MMRYVAILLVFGFYVARSQSIDLDFMGPLPIRAAKIEAMVPQPDGKILIGGDIAFYESQRVDNLVRLNADGSLDASFTFNYSGDFLVFKLALMSNGNIVALLRRYESMRYLIYNETILVVIGPTGAILNQVTGLTGGAAIAVQADNSVLLAAGNALKRYSSTLQPDTNFNAAVVFNNALTDVAVVGTRIYVSGVFSQVNGVTRHDIARLETSGALDLSFNTEDGTSDRVGSITVQADGKVLLGSSYINEFNGEPGRGGMLRLNSDGTVDDTFTPPVLNGPASEIVAMANGTLYAAAFLDYENGPADRFFRMLPTGSLDLSFEPIRLDEAGAIFSLNVVLTDNAVLLNNTSFSGNVFGLSRFTMASAPDDSFTPEVGRFGTITVGDHFQDKLIVTGDFIRINGFETFGIARLGLNGLLDETFALHENFGPVKQIEILDENNILVSTQKYFVKLNSVGDIKPEFNFSPFDDLYQVIKFDVLPDGKIMAADANNIYRLTATGAKDVTFDIGSGIDDVVSTAFDFDMQGEKVIYGSFFSVYNSQNVKKIIRLNPTGSVDTGFDVGAGPADSDPLAWAGITMIKVLDNNEILVGGFFSTFAGHPVAHGLVKLDANGAINLEFNHNQANAPAPNEVYFMDAQVEQIGSRIFIRQPNSTALYVIDTSGRVVTDFVIPSETELINHLIVVRQSPDAGRVGETQDNMFALGFFQQADHENPTFILKMQVNEVVTGLEVADEPIIETVFPNVFRDTFRVRLSERAESPTLRVHQASGSLLHIDPVFYSPQEIEVDLSFAPAGLYFLQVTTPGGQSEVARIIKVQ